MSDPSATFTVPEPDQGIPQAAPQQEQPAAPQQEPQPAAPQQEPQPAAPQQEQEWKVPPEWEKTLEDAGIPDLLKPKLYEQIRKSELNAQSAIQAARGTIEPEWQGLLANARSMGIKPADLVVAYNQAMTIQEDPEAFGRALMKNIDDLVASGQYTYRHGKALKEQVEAAVEGAADGELGELTPEAKELAEIKQRLDAREAQERQETEQRTAQERQAQAAREAEAYADSLFRETEAQFAADEVLKAANKNTQAVVVRNAHSLIEGDPTGTLTVAEAVKQSLAELRAAAGLAAAPTTAGGAGAPPVGGGGGGAAAAVPEKKAMTPAEREAAMLAEAARIAAAG